MPIATVNERTTARYTVTFEDEAGDPIPAADLTTLALTLYDRATGAVINSREAQDALNANGVTVSSAGVLAWTLDPADNAVVGEVAVGNVEVHVALFEWTWDSGAKAGRHEVEIAVLNLGKVT